MAVYSIITQRVENATSQVTLWHLDFPCMDQYIDGVELTRDGLLFQGWLLNENEKLASLVEFYDLAVVFGLQHCKF